MQIEFETPFIFLLQNNIRSNNGDVADDSRRVSRYRGLFERIFVVVFFLKDEFHLHTRLDSTIAVAARLIIDP